ncbi:hypothetical protein ABBQ38_003335 [Trebouxia sp. C0009 RCD-2024]
MLIVQSMKHPRLARNIGISLKLVWAFLHRAKLTSTLNIAACACARGRQRSVLRCLRWSAPQSVRCRAAITYQLAASSLAIYQASLGLCRSGQTYVETHIQTVAYPRNGLL